MELPLVEPFVTRHGVWAHRDVLLVHVFAEGTEGWAECVAPTEPTYLADYTDGSARVLLDHLIPRFFAGADDDVVGHPTARAALSTAVLDAQLRAAGRSLAEELGATAGAVPAGAALGFHDDLGLLVDTVAELRDAGYHRVKLKIAPGRDRQPLARLRDAFGDELVLQADANGSYDPTEPGEVLALDEFSLLHLEQPFGADHLVDHIRLASRANTPVCLDESVTSVQTGVDLVALGAASVLALKPGRLGGYGAARELHDRAADDASLWVGGMLETGLGRAGNLALAALPGFDLPGDLAAADRYWERDLITTPTVLGEDGMIAVPDGPGLGVEVDRDYLAHVTTSVVRVEAPR